MFSSDLITFTFIGRLSAVYLSVAATFKLVLLIAIGVVLFHESVSTTAAIGLAVAIFGFSVFSWQENREQFEKEAKRRLEERDERVMLVIEDGHHR